MNRLFTSSVGLVMGLAVVAPAFAMRPIQGVPPQMTRRTVREQMYRMPGISSTGLPVSAGARMRKLVPMPGLTPDSSKEDLLRLYPDHQNSRDILKKSADERTEVPSLITEAGRAKRFHPPTRRTLQNKVREFYRTKTQN